MEQIKVTISSTGEVAYEVKGVRGAGCKALTKAIDALGNVRETKTTGEYAQATLGEGVRQRTQ